MFLTAQVPHVKVTMYHEVEADPDLLLRGELLVVASTMHSLLCDDRFFDHVTIPVMLFSVVPPSHLRILIAILDGSPAYHFQIESFLMLARHTRDVGSDDAVHGLRY
ncbi:uncharacterized protein BO97DRAFT_428331 [Aspergillus homomorphus CBS 101889]|uniref:Uncharacterized protein n=1 Tax=Aspergillus homomorphus (strain CBS 101889) TaxID=1450537 RepID=A0A395HKX3_ASPHC|nr:hypothetical protein BO97DRAFT_428331 [Aspergillus homomorphus CBS 101889]RAL08507.1 hypothetical protein BO97DRAFT_428331 [Aspergillus homomorphus CBS 101889]